MGHLVQRYLSNRDQNQEQRFVTIADLDALKHDILDLKNFTKQMLEPQPDHTSINDRSSVLREDLSNILLTPVGTDDGWRYQDSNM